MNKLFLLLALLSLNVFSNAQTKNFLDQPYIETKAEADSLVVPDRIYLSILISEKDTQKRQSVEDLEQLMAVKLEQMGIDLNKQLSLTDLSSNFKKYFLRKQDILKAKSYQLLVYDAKTAGRVIYEMEGIGIANVDLDRTEYSKIEALQLALKYKAITKAMQQAQAMVQPLNLTLGKAIYISDVESNVYNNLAGSASGIVVRGYSPVKKNYNDLPITFEKIEVKSKVSVKFKLN